MSLRNLLCQEGRQLPNAVEEVNHVGSDKDQAPNADLSFNTVAHAPDSVPSPAAWTRAGLLILNLTGSAELKSGERVESPVNQEHPLRLSIPKSLHFIQIIAKEHRLV